MTFFTEVTLLKMETFWTRRRKEWNDPSLRFWDVLWNPAFFLKPSDEYNRKLYWRVAITLTLGTLLIVVIALSLGLAIGTLLFPEFLPIIRNPRNHASQIGILSREGFYQLPLYPLIILSFSLLFEWPRRFFWNRRAKRLQKEGLVQVPPIVMAEAAVEDSTIWPPPPRRTI